MQHSVDNDFINLMFFADDTTKEEYINKVKVELSTAEFINASTPGELLNASIQNEFSENPIPLLRYAIVRNARSIGKAKLEDINAAINLIFFNIGQKEGTGQNDFTSEIELLNDYVLKNDSQRYITVMACISKLIKSLSQTKNVNAIERLSMIALAHYENYGSLHDNLTVQFRDLVNETQKFGLEEHSARWMKLVVGGN